MEYFIFVWHDGISKRFDDLMPYSVWKAFEVNDDLEFIEIHERDHEGELFTMIHERREYYQYRASLVRS